MDIFRDFMDLVAEIFSAFWSIIPKAFMFLLWVLLAIVILPCVYIAAEIYPKWVEWGEDL